MESLTEATLDSCREYIPRLIEAVSKIACDIQSGNETQGIRLIPVVFDGLQWLTEAIRGMQQIGFSIGIDLQDITGCFEQLEKALEIRDYVLTADLFEYEIGPALENWLKTIEQCSQREK
ncbi:MAG: hypothetical protein ACYC0Q_02910 [Eubacteriales bacterium]